jgi:hypothetical protein
MGLFYRTDGLTSYYSDDGGDVKERSHTSAYTQSGSTLEYTASDIYGDSNSNPFLTSIWFSSDGTKLYIVWTDLEYYDSDDGYMEQFSLSTAWDLSTVNTTPVTTLTLPKGTEYPYYPTTGTALYSDYTGWMGLEWADDGLSFYFLRYEASEYVYNVGRDSVTFKVDYTLTTAWNLSTASLSSTTKIAISEETNTIDSAFCSMYHTMSGGEIVLSKGGDFLQIDSISDTTANFTSNIGGGTNWFFSDDETLLLGNGTYTCYSGAVKIDTNYVQSTSNELVHADGGTHVDITNESTTSQSLTYTWKYVSYTGAKPTVTYLGTNRSAGYTTPNITSTFSTDNYPPFTFSSGSGGANITFRMTLISATVDTIDENNAFRDITVLVL